MLIVYIARSAFKRSSNFTIHAKILILRMHGSLSYTSEMTVGLL